MKKFLIGLISLTVLHCQNGPSQKEYDDLKSQLEECSKENEELKNTPENRLLSAQKLGFKVLEQKTSIKQGDCKLTFSNIKLTNRWIFDRYGNEWRYIEAERGNKYLTFTLSITAESKSPNLPPIYVYQLVNGQLQYKTTAYYKFYRWEDYASYLGNNADYGNDFARSETIRFSPGAQLVMEDFNKYPTFLMVKKSNCVIRNEDRFGNPPISYSNSTCDYDRILTVDKANEDYFTIKIYNQEKI